MRPKSKACDIDSVPIKKSPIIENTIEKRKTNLNLINIEGIFISDNNLTGSVTENMKKSKHKNLAENSQNLHETTARSPIPSKEDSMEYQMVNSSLAVANNVQLEESANKSWADEEPDNDNYSNTNVQKRPSPFNDDFVEPKKTCFLNKYLKTHKDIDLRNRFDSLSDIDEKEQSVQNTQANRQSENTSKRNDNDNKKYKIPPIVINRKLQEHKGLIQDLKNKLKKGFYLKFTKNSTLIFASEESEYKDLLRELEDTDISHHYYTISKDKNHAFVLRGLDSEPALSEIEESLEEEYSIRIKKIFKMKTKSRPLFLVTTNSAVTLSWLNHNVKFLLNTRIYWERRKSERDIIQCHRCQAWGHATTNCRHPYKCLKCAECHPTHSCQKPKDTPAKCANCSEDHPANSVSCKIYKEKVDRLQSRKAINSGEMKTNNRSTFTYNSEEFPAPTPKKNFNWFTSQNQQHTSSTAANSSNNQQINNDAKGTDLISAVHKELDILNNKINLNEVLNALQDLNRRLSTVSNNFEVILIMQQFKEDVVKYNFFK